MNGLIDDVNMANTHATNPLARPIVSKSCLIKLSCDDIDESRIHHSAKCSYCYMYTNTKFYNGWLGNLGAVESS